MKRSLYKECLRLARSKNNPISHSEYKNYMHYSFIIQGNKIIEWGMNRPGNATPFHGFEPTRHKIHSEVDAYKKAKGLLDKSKNFSIVNLRLNRKGEPRMSAPCKCCMNFLETVGCNGIHYSTDQGWETYQ